jgi:membrane-associated phospholipid phosphatase
MVFFTDGLNLSAYTDGLNLSAYTDGLNLSAIADGVSLSIFAAFLLPLLTSATLIVKLGSYLILYIVYSVSNIIKKTLNLPRPRGASHCSLLLGNTRSSGMPSIHMAFLTYLLCTVPVLPPYTTSLGLLWILAMGWSRWYKQCHSISQVIAGIGVGLAFSIVFSVLFKQPIPFLSQIVPVQKS